MQSITIKTPDGLYTARVIETISETSDATAYIVEVDEAGKFAAIVYRDGDIITSSDWQGTCGHHERETVLDELADAAWAHHWMRARDHAPCVVVNGLPRVLG